MTSKLLLCNKEFDESHKLFRTKADEERKSNRNSICGNSLYLDVVEAVKFYICKLSSMITGKCYKTCLTKILTDDSGRNVRHLRRSLAAMLYLTFGDL